MPGGTSVTGGTGGTSGSGGTSGIGGTSGMGGTSGIVRHFRRRHPDIRRTAGAPSPSPSPPWPGSGGVSPPLPGSFWPGVSTLPRGRLEPGSAWEREVRRRRSDRTVLARRCRRRLVRCRIRPPRRRSRPCPYLCPWASFALPSPASAARRRGPRAGWLAALPRSATAPAGTRGSRRSPARRAASDPSTGTPGFPGSRPAQARGSRPCSRLQLRGVTPIKRNRRNNTTSPRSAFCQRNDTAGQTRLHRCRATGPSPRVARVMKRTRRKIPPSLTAHNR